MHFSGELGCSFHHIYGLYLYTAPGSVALPDTLSFTGPPSASSSADLRVPLLSLITCLALSFSTGVT